MNSSDEQKGEMSQENCNEDRRKVRFILILKSVILAMWAGLEVASCDKKQKI